MLTSGQNIYDVIVPSSGHTTDLDYFISHAYHDLSFIANIILKSEQSSCLYMGDPQKNLYYISDKMRDSFGFPGNLVENLPEKWYDHIYKQSWKDLHERDHKNVLQYRSEFHDIRYQVIDKNGEVFWVRDREYLQWNQEKTKILFVAGKLTSQDDLFIIDPLTNFPMENVLCQRLELLRQYHCSCTTIGFRLNHISDINAKYGRAVSERLIRNITSALMDQLTGKMSFYRLYGMYCMALVDSNVAESPRELVAEMRFIIESVYRKMKIYISQPCFFAVMQFPQAKAELKDYVGTMTALLEQQSVEHSAEYITDSLENLNKISEYADMKLALSNDVLLGMRNFRAVIQPIVSTDTGRITGGETLMRWNYNGKEISPAVFIPLLEESGLILSAGKWIIEEAVKACCELVKYIPEYYLSVNLSLCQLKDETLCSDIFHKLKQYHLDGKHLVLEITESYIPKDTERFHKLMDACAEMNTSLAVDDFGTGYSSLSSLLYYNLNFIKIDRSLLLEMEKSEEKSKFICSMVDAFHKLGKKICMEGVETEIQRTLAQKAGCDYIQGFYYYRPSAVEEVCRIVRQQHCRESEQMPEKGDC